MISIDELIKKSDVETAFIILLCRLYMQSASEDEIVKFLKNNKIDEKRFYYLVCQNSIRPVVNNVITKYKIDISEDVKKRLVNDSKHFLFNSLNHLREISRLVELFNNNGINIIPYKGATFAYAYYNNLSLREAGDIDFLVLKEDIPAIQQIIYSEGYNSPIQYHYCEPSYQFAHTPSLDVNNDTKDQRNIHLEFHYHILNQDFGMVIENLPLMFDADSLKISGKQIPMPSHEANCKIILTHHGMDDIWLSLKYYLDLALLCKKDENFNWDGVLAFCKQYGFYDNACIGFKNMELLLGIKSPVKTAIVNENLRTQILNVLLLHDYYKDRYLKKTQLRIKTRDGYKWKAKMTSALFMRFIRPRDLDFKLFNLPPILYPLYYIIKPVRVFYRFTIGPLFFGDKNNTIFR